jgi:hypothetical protein
MLNCSNCPHYACIDEPGNRCPAAVELERRTEHDVRRRQREAAFNPLDVLEILCDPAGYERQKQVEKQERQDAAARRLRAELDVFKAVGFLERIGQCNRETRARLTDVCQRYGLDPGILPMVESVTTVQEFIELLEAEL